MQETWNSNSTSLCNGCLIILIWHQIEWLEILCIKQYLLKRHWWTFIYESISNKLIKYSVIKVCVLSLNASYICKYIYVSSVVNRLQNVILRVIMFITNTIYWLGMCWYCFKAIIVWPTRNEVGVCQEFNRYLLWRPIIS